MESEALILGCFFFAGCVALGMFLVAAAEAMSPYTDQPEDEERQ